MRDVSSWSLWRAITAGVIGGVGALVAHTVAGGEVSPGGASLVVAVAVLLGFALVRFRLSVPRVVGAAAVLQATAHMTFVTPGVSEQDLRHPGHDLSGLSSVSDVGMTHSGDDVFAMLLAHIVVALLTALTVLATDRAWIDIARDWLLRGLRPLSSALAPPLTADVVQHWTVWRPPTALWANSVRAPRGPPHLLRGPFLA